MNSLPKTVTRQRRGCDLNPGHSAPESSTLTTRLPSDPPMRAVSKIEKPRNHWTLKTVTHRAISQIVRNTHGDRLLVFDGRRELGVVLLGLFRVRRKISRDDAGCNA